MATATIALPRRPPYLQDPNDPNYNPALATGTDAAYLDDNSLGGAGLDDTGLSQPNMPGPAGVVTGGPGNTYGGGFTNTTSPGQMLSQNRMNIFGMGTANDQAIRDAIARYGSLEEAYRQTGDQAYADLAKTPGYTPREAGQINVDYGRFRTSPGDLGKRYLTGDEQSAIAGDPNAPKNIMDAGVGAEGAMLNQFQANLGGEVGAEQANVSGQLGNYGDYLGDATGSLDTGLTRAQGKFGMLDRAVNDPSLQFDPNATEKQLTDSDVQDQINSAARTIQTNAQAQKDEIARRAAAQGNTSPAAVAAMQDRVDKNSAVAQADAETNARIAAKQAQFGRAADIESQRASEARTRTGMQAQAGTTEEAAAQAAAGLSGTQRIRAAEDLGSAGISAAERVGETAIGAARDYGEFSTGTAADMASKQYGAGLTAEQTAAARARDLALNRQATTGDVQNTEYGQGVQTTGLTAGGAKTVADARRTGQQQVRDYLTGQQQMAQGGGLTSRGQQIANFGTTASGINQAGGAQVQNMATGTSPATWLGTFFEEGGVVTEPTVGVLGERGPEAVIPLQKQKVRRYLPKTMEAA